MDREFNCYKCEKNNLYKQEDYDEVLKKKEMIVAWREMIYFIKCIYCNELNRVDLQAFSNQAPVLDSGAVVGRIPTIRDKFYLDLAGEFVKNNSKLLNEILKQLVTMNTALLAGTIAFMSSEVIDLRFKSFIILAFLTSLGIAFYGVLPYTGKFSFLNPFEVEEFNNKATKRKLIFVWCSGLLSLIGFILILIAMLNKQFQFYK